MSRPLRVAIWGAPLSGKTTLATALRAMLQPAADYDIADTTPWLHALLSGPSVPHTAPAVPHQSRVDLTLLTGLDISPVGTALTLAQRKRQAQMDHTLRAALTQHALPFALVYGSGGVRYANAMRAIQFHLRQPEVLQFQPSRWRWACETCSVPACEHSLFSTLLQSA
jgi:nicotinamide riboside kinase